MARYKNRYSQIVLKRSFDLSSSPITCIFTTLIQFGLPLTFLRFLFVYEAAVLVMVAVVAIISLFSEGRMSLKLVFVSSHLVEAIVVIISIIALFVSALSVAVLLIVFLLLLSVRLNVILFLTYVCISVKFRREQLLIGQYFAPLVLCRNVLHQTSRFLIMLGLI